MMNAAWRAVNRAEAAEMAISSPLLEDDIDLSGARGVLRVNVRATACVRTFETSVTPFAFASG